MNAFAVRRIVSIVALAVSGAVAAQAQTPTSIPKTNWTVWFVDSQETSGENGAATNAFDNNPATYWHSQWQAAKPNLPHELHIHLGASHDVTGFRYLPRQDGKINGTVANYEFYVSDDGVNWGTPVATGTFTANATEKQVDFSPKTGRYVRFRALTEHSGTTYRTCVAELSVLEGGSTNQRPQGTITSPTGNLTIPLGGSVSFAGSGNDPDGNLPLTYLWSFGSGSGLANSTAQNPTAGPFNNPGTFVTTFTVSDALGAADPTPPTVTITVEGPPVTAIPKINWALRFVDSQETVGENAAATNAFDNNPNTYWHSQWQAAQPPVPHEIQIDLAGTYNVTGFRYLPRQDGKTKGRVGQYEFYVSANPTNWGSPVATGTFANSANEQEVRFTPKAGQFVRFRALTEIGGTYRTAVAELGVLQSGSVVNLAPNGIIDAPSDAVTIPVGGSVSFSGTGSDPDNHLPLAYRWNFGAGSGVADITSEDPGTIQFNNPGTYTVTFTVTDSQGLADSTPPTRTVTVQGAASTDIAKSPWALVFVDSQETSGENAAATNAFDGNPNTYWHSQWQAAQPPVPHEIQINLGGVHNVSGFRYLPRQDGKTKGMVGQYEFYVSTNPSSWGAPVATGTFINDASEKQIQFTPKVGQYVRFRALTEAGGTYRTAVAELSVQQSGAPINRGPDSVIDAPAGNVTIGVGGSVTFSGTGTDPDHHTPLSYQWTFGAGSGLPTTSVEDPGSVHFNNPGVFTVRFAVTDSLGLTDATPATRTITVQAPEAAVLPRTGWTWIYADSYEPTSVFNGKSGHPSHAFDGNVNTLWHTRSETSRPPPPHEIQIDLGATHSISGFRYLPRQDNNQKGRIGFFEFYVATTPSNWGSPVATGNLENTESPSDVYFAAKTGRFIRLRALSEVNGQPFTSLAELYVLSPGAATAAPNGTINLPTGDITIAAGSVVNFTSTATDPDGNLPLHHRWSFGSSGISDLNTPDPGLLEFNTPGVHTVSLTVADAWGSADPTPATRTVTVLGGTALPQTGWTLHYVDSEELTAGNHAGTQAFDGLSSTFWHTEWSDDEPAHPHELQIDLGGFYDVGGLRYLARQDGQTDGRVGLYQFYVSTDGVHWGSPIVAGYLADTAAQQELQFSPAVGRYIRFRALSEFTWQPFTSAAEIGVLVPAIVAPSVRLIEPRSLALKTSSSLRVRADGYIPNAHGVRLMIDGGTAAGGAQSDDYSWPFERVFTGLAPGEHVVEAFIINPSGDPVLGTSTYDRASPVGIGDYYVAMGDSITFGIADDVHGDNNSQDGRNRGGGWTPLLADLLTVATGRPVHVANEGKPGELSGGGVLRIRSLLEKHPDAQRFLILFGTNDAAGYDGVTPIPSGLGLSPGQPGYAGSYKENMQTIIDAVLSAGKTPILAKVPFVNGSAVFDARVQQYNLVINELVAANNLPITGPDFHSYFATHAATEYFPGDAVHPNGLGFQSMAELWLQALE